MTLFPIVDYWWFYVGFTFFVLALLSLDLGVFHKKAHEVSFKEAGAWTVIWISLAFAFNLILYKYAFWKFSHDEQLLATPGFDAAGAAKQVALEFLTGFVLEKSLAVDNIFIFAMVFNYFAVPKVFQHRILFFGILGALIFRGIFITLGSYLMAYHWILIFFGCLLLLTGAKMMFTQNTGIDPDDNIIFRLLKKTFRVHPKIEGEQFFLKKNGLLYATPLFRALIFIELSDIILALDSVPAIFAITKEPLIVYTSNIFAILGLRSMYFMLAGIMDRFVYIKYGLASVLIFVGLKMVWLNDAFAGKFPTGLSLGIIGTLIGSSILLSLIADKRKRSKVEPHELRTPLSIGN